MAALLLAVAPGVAGAEGVVTNERLSVDGMTTTDPCNAGGADRIVLSGHTHIVVVQRPDGTVVTRAMTHATGDDNGSRVEVISKGTSTRGTTADFSAFYRFVVQGSPENLYQTASPDGIVSVCRG
jgi:hypothetical protein